MSRASSRRGLLLVALLLGVLLLLVDLLRPDPLVVRVWRGLTPNRQTEVERGLDEFRRTRGESIRR